MQEVSIATLRSPEGIGISRGSRVALDASPALFVLRYAASHWVVGKISQVAENQGDISGAWCEESAREAAAAYREGPAWPRAPYR